METQEFVRRSHLDTPTLDAWVEAEWLIPVSSGKTLDFSDADLARVRLIRDLKVDFGVNDEGIAIVLHLLESIARAALPAEGYSRGGHFRSRQRHRMMGVVRRTTASQWNA